MTKVAFALTLAIVLGATGDVLLSTGMQLMGAVSVRRLNEIPRLIAIVFSSPYVMFGVVSMAIYFASYIAALAWGDGSVANPLTALSYLLATAYARLIMHERIGWQRGAGVLMIVIGAIFVGVSS